MMIALLLVAFAFPAALTLINWWMVASTRASVFESTSAIPHHKVAVVLGARVYASGRLSTMLEDRVAAGVRLYKGRKVEKLLMSGDNSERHYDEVTAMRDRAIALGVPSDDVVRDFAGFRTWDSFVRARRVWGLSDVTVVTQRFHMARSLAIARAAGLQADGLVADSMYYGTSQRRAELREVAARFLAWIDIFLWRPNPKFLGPPEGLSGDAQRAR